MEANLLRYLVQHEGQAVSRKAMLEEVWGVHEDTDTRAIDNFIVRLRRYIEDDPTAAAPPADRARRGLPVRRPRPDQGSTRRCTHAMLRRSLLQPDSRRARGRARAVSECAGAAAGVPARPRRSAAARARRAVPRSRRR